MPFAAKAAPTDGTLIKNKLFVGAAVSIYVSGLGVQQCTIAETPRISTIRLWSVNAENAACP